jgi:hypothetical protein
MEKCTLKAMKRISVIMLCLVFAGCESPLESNHDPGKFTWVAEEIDKSTERVVPLTVDLAEPSDWENLLATISYKMSLIGKHVDLDISGSTWPGLAVFDPGTFKTGKKYISKLTLPDISTSIVGGTEENPVFKHFFEYL